MAKEEFEIIKTSAEEGHRERLEKGSLGLLSHLIIQI